MEIAKEQGNTRGVAVSKAQLGTLAFLQGELAEAAERHKEAQVLFQSINEPVMEAVAWHQLGMIYQDAEHWEAAEQAYRKAAQLKHEQGLLGGSNGAGSSWDQLAQVCKATGRMAEAEQWYGKALAARQAADDQPGMATTLNNLAALLANQPARLDEARGLAEEGLAIFETLDPAAAQIWTIYELLARIANQQKESSQAAAYRAKGRQAYLAFPAWRQQVQRYKDLIEPVVQAAADAAVRKKLAQALYELTEVMGANLIAAIRRILSGQRDEAALCGPLDWQEAAVIRAILEGITETR